MTETYLTIGSTGESLLKEKSSKFYAFAYAVSSKEEVREKLNELKNSHHSARHWCYAYRLGEDGGEHRSNDDGEPSHSAGDPILRQIESRELTYTLVVVVRYFGGIKLGVGGLIQAYGGAASLALDESKIIEKVITERIYIAFGYEDMSDVMRSLKKHNAEMREHEFLTKCTLTAEIERRKLQDFLDELGLLHRIEFKKL
jgi:uncharacterized YigZ family protein